MVFKQAMSFSQFVLVDFLSEVVQCSIQHFETKVNVSHERFVRQTTTTSNIQHDLSFSHGLAKVNRLNQGSLSNGAGYVPVAQMPRGKRVALSHKRLSVLKL